MRFSILTVTALNLFVASSLIAEDRVKQLIEDLAAPDSSARVAAMDELIKQGSPVVPALVGALESGDPGTRAYAAHALGQIGDKSEKVVQAMLKCVVDKDAEVRRSALSALRKLDPPQETTMPIMVKVLEGSDPRLASMAIGEMVADHERALPRVIVALQNDAASYWGCVAVAAMGPQAKQAVPYVVKLLNHKDEEVRMQALLALAEVGPQARQAAGPIAKTLESDRFGGVQYAAAFALGRIGATDKASIAALNRARSSTDEFLKMISTWALAKHSSNDELVKDAVSLLIAGLTSDSQFVRRGAAQALADFAGHSEIVAPALFASLQDADPTVVSNALDALASLGAKSLNGLRQGLTNKDLRGYALLVVQRLGAEAKPIIPDLIALLDSPLDDEADRRFRVELQYTLSRIGADAKAAVPTLIGSLDSDDEDIRNTAFMALAKMGPAASAAVPALRERLNSKVEFVRTASAWALLDIVPDDAAINKLAAERRVSALDHENESVRGEAARTLGTLGKYGLAAIPALQKAMDDESQAVRDAVANALKQLQDK